MSIAPKTRLTTARLAGVDWCVIGGRSGDEGKLFNLAWAQDLHQQCLKTGTSLFLKQLGSNAWQNSQALTLLDRHGGDWVEWPREFRVREMPVSFYGYRTNMMFRAEESACAE